MAKCKYCDKDMLIVDSCDCTTVKIDGKEYKPVKYGDEIRIDWEAVKYKCHDCGVSKGGYHHPGCGVEECPVCHGQLISCGCLDDTEE